MSPKDSRGTYFVKMAMIIDNVHGLNNVDVPQGDSNAEFSGHLALVLLLRLSLSTRPELFDSVGRAALLLGRLDQPDRPASTTSKDLAPFAILLGQMRMRRLVEGGMSESDDGVRDTRVLRSVLRRGDTGGTRGGVSG